MALTSSTMLPLGSIAPAFRLPDTSGVPVSLDDFKDDPAMLERRRSLVQLGAHLVECDGGLNALGCFKRADLARRGEVLTYGALGAIGTAAVQLARHFRVHVTAVCGTNNVDLVRSLGAGTVIDYMKEDFTRNGQTYDVIFDAVGKHSFARCKQSLAGNGVFLATDNFRNLALAIWTPLRGGKRVVFLPEAATRRDVQFLKQLVEDGEFKPVIDRRYRIDDVVEAARYVETEQKVGNVILDIA